MGVYAITGASSGIGAKTKELLEKQGHQVINIDLKDGDICANLATEEGRKEAILEKTYGKQVIITGCEQEYFEGLEINNKIFVEKGACKSCI